MSDENKTTAPFEDSSLHIHPEKLTDITLQVPEKAMRSLKRVAERRELPIEAAVVSDDDHGIGNESRDGRHVDVLSRNHVVCDAG